MGKGELIKLDAAVAEILGSGERKAKERRMPHEERAALLKEREKAAKRKDRRVGYDMEPEVIAKIKHIADVNETPASQVAQLFLQMVIAEYDKGSVDVSKYRKICEKNPKFLYKLEWTPAEEGD